MLRRLWPYWRAARKETAGGGSVLVAATLLDLLQPWPIKWLVDHVFGNQPAPDWLNSIWPAFRTNDVAGGIAAVCITILVLAVLHRLCLTAGQFFLVRAGARVVQQLRCHANDHLHRLSLAYHDRTKVGDSLYRVAYDSHGAQSLINGALVPIALGVLLLTGAVVIMLQMNVLLTLTTMAAAPVFFLIIRGFSRRMDEESRQYHENESRLISAVQESLSSMRAIQAFTLERQTRERFGQQAIRSLEANERMTRTQLLYAGCAGVAVAAGTALVVWVAGREVMHGRLSVGEILVFLAYLGMLYQPMNTFCQSAGVVQAANAQLKRVFEIIDAIPEIQDRPGAVRPALARGALEFRQVSFEYRTGCPVLEDINLTIEPGRIVALAGRSGAGKTTMASLLLRFYDPVKGAVLLDGRDLRDLRLEWLRQQVSLVLQDPILFSASIFENIRYGRPDASFEEVQRAAGRAQADEFIRALPEGYNTLLGERGVNLSGGQRQRLSIARAFLKNAPILILDEPTSALDVQTEEALIAVLQELMRERTTLVIAHRLSTIRQADLVVVLDRGRVIESGSHKELLSRGGLYQAMCRSQWEKPHAVTLMEQTVVPA